MLRTNQTNWHTGVMVLEEQNQVTNKRRNAGQREQERGGLVN